MKRLFNDGWSFVKTSADTDINEVMQFGAWGRVDIPHDWLIWQTEDLYETSTGWYRKKFTSSGKGVTILRFGGVYMDSKVYVNGSLAGGWKYGYSTFEVDISAFVQEGENEVAVRVDHFSPNSRWYSGAGIFRNVYIIEHEGAYLKSDGVYFSAKKSGEVWEVKLSSEAVGEGALTVKYTVKNKDGVLFAAEGRPDEEITLGVENPRLWDIDSPERYTLVTELYDGERLCDSTECTVGFRTLEFRADKGFFINGRNVKINGVCLHHDLGALGSAVNKAATRRQLLSMKEMGANSVRTSHNMPSEEFMELCDELGILVDSEAFDMWELKKTDYDYARFFDDWYKKDVASWVRRDRNHPSVLMWSVGNEIYDTHASPRGEEVTKLLCAEVRRHDPRGNAYTTIGSNYIEWEGAQRCAEHIDLVGYNYGERLYPLHREIHPTWKIYGSETAARTHSRGIYHFPKSAAYNTHDDLQCSSLENCRAGVGERTVQYSIIADRDTPFSAGQYIWTGSDYIGEPSPYSTKNAYYGSIDTAGFKKDTFYVYEAAWTDKTVLHLMPYWDFNDGQLIDVMVYTNQAEAELFLNGVSQGRKQRGSGYSIDWQLPYEKGELVAVGYDSDGNITAKDSTRSFGESAGLRLTPDKTELTGFDDMIFVDISAYDKDGTFVANARNRVSVSVSGAGRLVGLDSGDSTDYDEYKGCSKKLFSGKLLAMIAGVGKSGEISVRVCSEGLPDSEITLYSDITEIPEGASDAFIPNSRDFCIEIPARKIELTASSQQLTKENPTAELTAKLLPETAEYPLEWKAVTDTGVVTNIAEVLPDSGNNNLTAKVIAKGDGNFRVRCICRNGKPCEEIISELEMSISGLGNAVVDPYGLVKAGLYNISEGVLDEVSEGGVRVGKGTKIVGFKNVRFGRGGADTFSLRLINWHSNDEVYFTLWKGVPGEVGAERLGDFTYQADFIWQTYIENTFTLSHPLKGECDLTFEFADTDKRIYFGGFKFMGEEAYSEIAACDISDIHGDKYTVTERGVEKIGNNVFIGYTGFDFARGVSSITVKGRTRNERDSVHLRIVGEGKELREILEFERSKDIIEKTFPIENFVGMGDVKLEFLPGCDFDLISFRFEPPKI